MQEAANAIIEEPGRPMREKLEAAARLWVESGRRDERLLSGVALFAAQCWLMSRGDDQSQASGFDPSISDFVAASKAVIGGEAGWNAMLSERAFCSECRMSFHLENLGICTGCMEYACGACESLHKNRCGAEVVG